MVYHINSLLTTHNFSFHFLLQLFPQTVFNSRTVYVIFISGFVKMAFPLIPQNPNVSSLALLNVHAISNQLHPLTLPAHLFLSPRLLKLLGLFLIQISVFTLTLRPSPNHATFTLSLYAIFVLFLI